MAQKCGGVREYRDRLVESVCLTQFYHSIPESGKLWVQDREGVETVQRAAELADEYVTRRKLSGDEDNYPDPRSGVSRLYFLERKCSQVKDLGKAEAGSKVGEKTRITQMGSGVRKP